MLHVESQRFARWGSGSCRTGGIALDGELYQRDLQLHVQREADAADQLVRIRGTISEHESSPYLEYLCVSLSFSKLYVYATLLDVVVAS